MLEYRVKIQIPNEAAFPVSKQSLKKNSFLVK